MSRTTRKNIKIGICTGTNTEYYRDRTRKMRRKYAANLRNLISKFAIDVAEELIMNPKFPRRDDWDEPTDGTRLITRQNANFWSEYVKEVDRQLRFHKKNKRGFNLKNN